MDTSAQRRKLKPLPSFAGGIGTIQSLWDLPSLTYMKKNMGERDQPPKGSSLISNTGSKSFSVEIIGRYLITIHI